MDELLNIAWPEYSSNISETLKNLREKDELSDVTLVCEGGEISAHKLVLFSGSSFFQDILTKHVHEHPLIFITGVQVGHLRHIIDFMYDGEINVAQEDIETLIKTAEQLKVKGLSSKQSNKKGEEKRGHKENVNTVIENENEENEKDNNDNNEINSDNNHLSIKCETELIESQARFEQVECETSYDDPSIESDINMMGEGEEKFDEWLEGEQKKNDNLEEEALNLMIKAEDPNNRVTWICKVCRKTSSDKTRIRKHVKGIHLIKEAKKKENDLNVEEKYKVSFRDDDAVLDTFEDYQAKIASLMEKMEGANNRVIWFCRECRKTNSDKTRIRKHVETHIQDLMFECLFCDAKRKCSGNMEVHVQKTHTFSM